MYTRTLLFDAYIAYVITRVNNKTPLVFSFHFLAPLENTKFSQDFLHLIFPTSGSLPLALLSLATAPSGPNDLASVAAVFYFAELCKCCRNCSRDHCVIGRDTRRCANDHKSTSKLFSQRLIEVIVHSCAPYNMISDLWSLIPFGELLKVFILTQLNLFLFVRLHMAFAFLF